MGGKQCSLHLRATTQGCGPNQEILKHRQAVEPIIGHLKADGWLERNHLKETEGDSMNLLLSCAGQNL